MPETKPAPSDTSLVDISTWTLDPVEPTTPTPITDALTSSRYPCPAIPAEIGARFERALRRALDAIRDEPPCIAAHIIEEALGL